jgi:hypothetical protein
MDEAVTLDSLVSSELLQNIFVKNSPLHDGAVIIRGGRIAAAACFLPTTQEAVALELGSRHRAALGITQVSDAIAVTVSEETGTVSLGHRRQTLERIGRQDPQGKTHGTASAEAAGKPAVSPEVIQMIERILQRDTWVKVLAVLLALYMWYEAMDGQWETRVFDLRLEFSDAPGKIVTFRNPDMVKVTFEGLARALDKIDPAKLIVPVDISSLEPGTNQVPMT